MHFSGDKLNRLDRKFKLNLINSISGIKPANLVGSVSEKNGSNLAIISSVVHVGSNPPLLGFIMRPTEEVPRNTYQNILENSFFTINHITTDMAERAHFTSAKFSEDISEFDRCHLEEEFKSDFLAPFVKESPVQIGLQLMDIIPIKINQTVLIIGEIKHLYLPEDSADERGYLRLDKLNGVGIGGLNCYYDLSKFAEFPYARVDEVPDFT